MNLIVYQKQVLQAHFHHRKSSKYLSKNAFVSGVRKETIVSKYRNFNFLASSDFGTQWGARQVLLTINLLKKDFSSHKEARADEYRYFSWDDGTSYEIENIISKFIVNIRLEAGSSGHLERFFGDLMRGRDWDSAELRRDNCHPRHGKRLVPLQVARIAAMFAWCICLYY